MTSRSRQPEHRENARWMLFVHGSYIDQTYWDEQVRYFSPHYQVVTLDLPGQGQSGRNRCNWSIEGYGGDVVALITGRWS